MYDLNEADEQRQDGVIPDGTFVKVVANIRPGGVDGVNPEDKGLLTQSKTTTTQMLDFEFTVLVGPHAKRKIWRYYPVLNCKPEAFQITARALRAMVESATGTDPKDVSEAARQKRNVPYLRVFDGIEFAIKVGIETSAGYADKNSIAHIVVPSDPEWAVVMQGGEVPAKPASTRRTAGTARAADPAPAWQQSTLPMANGNGAAVPAPAWGASAPAAPVMPPNSAGGATVISPPAWLKQ